MADLTRKLLLGNDSRGARGKFTRGSPVYNAASMAPNTGPQKVNYVAAAKRRIRQGAKK